MRTGIDIGSGKQVLNTRGSNITRLTRVMAVALVGLLFIGCAPVTKVHGYLPKPEQLDSLKEGSHTQREIEMMLGSPSTTASFDDETWYYINSIHHTYAWKAPIVISRQIVAIHFDEESKLITSVDKYSIEDGRLIAFAGDTTPTKGRELSFLEQLLGNVGRVSTETFEDNADR